MCQPWKLATPMPHKQYGEYAKREKRNEGGGGEHGSTWETIKSCRLIFYWPWVEKKHLNLLNTDQSQWLLLSNIINRYITCHIYLKKKCPCWQNTSMLKMYCILFTFSWMHFGFQSTSPQGRHKHAMWPSQSHCVVYIALFLPLSSATMKWLSREWGRNTRPTSCFRLAKRFVASADGCSWRSGCVPVLSTADHSQTRQRTLVERRAAKEGAKRVI